jgi:hypothetical protein
MSKLDILTYRSLKECIGAMDMPTSPAFKTVLSVANTLKSAIAGAYIHNGLAMHIFEYITINSVSRY